MAIEIERKWVSDAAPEVPGRAMRQGYLAIEGDVSVRLRLTDDRAVLTVKAGGGLARTEVELDVAPDEAEALWGHTAGRIDKVRSRVELGEGLVAEIDRYAGPLDGLVTVEVEFPDVAAAGRFVAPAWFGREVTGDHRWSNASLARRGRPG